MFGDTFEFDETETRLTDLKELRRWMTWVKTQVRVGIELEKAGSVRGGRNGSFAGALQASDSYERLGAFNVLNLVHDGSVNGGGNEILVVGNVEDFSTSHRKMTGLHAVFKQYGLRVDESCGMHYHLVAAQDDVLPGIVVKNFYQLVRRYYGGLLYMTATTGRRAIRAPRARRYTYPTPTSAVAPRPLPPGITRKGMRSYAKSTFLGITPLGKSMASVKSEIRDRYGAFNMGEQDNGSKDLMRFGANGSITRFHVEFRFPDASDSPAQIVSQMFLFRALLLKAVELSQFGVIKVDSNGTRWVKSKQVVNLLTTSENSWEPLPGEMTFDEAVEFAKNDAENLLRSLRSSIQSIDGESYDILQAIIEKPVWKRREEHQQWRRIEKTLMPSERVLEGVEQNLLRFISLNRLTGVKNIQHWKHDVAQKLGVTDNQLISAFRKLEKQVTLDFDRTLGSFVVRW
jgi:hypothetical protein